MVRAELMGGHTHTALSGVQVHVWRRGDRYIARGRLDGVAFGETLGKDAATATVRLRQLLTEIENGTYTRPSEARKRRTVRRSAPRLTLRELVVEFLAEKRKLVGQQTAGDYSCRLAPVLDFAEKTVNLKRWPLAADIDARFAQELRAFLFQHKSTRNGRPGGEPRPLSGRQILNVLECLRTMLHWAAKAANRKLPADWVMPLTKELIGEPPPKNPLREDKLPLEVRVEVARRMDRWQLTHLALSLVLPMRPDEVAGLTISDVNFDRGWLEFGHRHKDCNFTKGRTAFVVPFPDELRVLLRASIAGRAEGPLLRGRWAFEKGRRVEPVASPEHLAELHQAELLRLPAGTVQTAQDRKLVFRRLLRRMGGVSEDAMNREFKRLLAVAGLKNGATLYTLRGSVTTAMHRANLPHLELRYLTGHATNDILNEYATLDPVGAMQGYFKTIRPLLDAIQGRANELGLSAH